MSEKKIEYRNIIENEFKVTFEFKAGRSSHEELKAFIIAGMKAGASVATVIDENEVEEFCEDKHDW